jgi:Polyketide cyclase / dehydrase and lipid transport
MRGVAWEVTHSVETNASVEFAWRYWTDVKNWADPPATFALEGAFAVGARGVTYVPGQPPIDWFVRAVKPGETATIEIPVDGAAMSFSWRFTRLEDTRSRITQTVVLHGDKADAYLEAAKTLTTNIPDGLKKFAAAIASASANQKKAAP